MRVPVAAAPAAGNSFEQVLQQTVVREEPRPVAAPKPPREEPKARPRKADSEPSADQPVEPTDVVAQSNEDQVTEPVTHGMAETVQPDVTQSTSRGEPERQATAGKGSDSPRNPSGDGEPLLAAAVQHAAGAPNVVLPGVANAGVPAIGAARATAATGTAPTRGIDAAAQRSTAPLPPASVAGSYRTHNAASAQLLDQTRDSVFKQILMRLTGDGGEMRMHLEPPELGQLDLRMVLEHGNKMTLSIAAERHDVADLLHQHLDELKQTLQNAGIEITGAEVQTRSEFAQQSRENDRQLGHGGAQSAPAATDDQPTTLRARTFIAAEGLDFWA